MKHSELVRVIVPNKKGFEYLHKISGIEAVLVGPNDPIPESAKTAEILVVGPAEQQTEVDDALKQIQQLPNLRLLQTLGQGVEQWEGHLSSNLTVSTARGAHGGSTAEWVVAAIVSLVRDLRVYMKNQENHVWKGHRTDTLQNATILIYGVGDLGQNIQKRLQPFGANITMVGSHSREGVVDVSTAHGLLHNADVVIMALPLTQDTQNIVDTDFLALLPNGAIVVNAGRGGLVDQAALLTELHNGRLRAALDVTTPEPLPANNALWDAPGLLLTPHIGGNTDGADDRAWQMATEQIRNFLKENQSD